MSAHLQPDTQREHNRRHRELHDLAGRGPAGLPRFPLAQVHRGVVWHSSLCRHSAWRRLLQRKSNHQVEDRRSFVFQMRSDATLLALPI